MALNFLPEAWSDADAAAEHYERERTGLGWEFAADLQRSLDRITDSPDTLPRFEYYSGPLEIRRCKLARFPYAVIFECRPDRAVIVAVAHTSRNPLYWLDRLE